MQPPDAKRSRPGGGGSDEATAKSLDVRTVPDAAHATEASSASAVYGARPQQRRPRRTRADLQLVDDAIVTAVATEHPVTLRGVYYRVVSAGAVDKTEAGYRLVGRELLKLRRSGTVPYSWITDGTRWITKPDSHNDLDAMLADAAASYRRALWRDQAVEVHVFTEKDAISGVILPVTGRYDVPLGVLRGYCSESFAHSVAESISWSRKPTVVYQLGDHDPSGLDAWRNFQAKVTGFAPDADLTFTRLAVTPEQIDTYALPTRQTKRTDTRSRGFVGGSVEVDAIPPTILRGLIEVAIEAHIDQHALALTRSVEASERRWLTELAASS